MAVYPKMCTTFIIHLRGGGVMFHWVPLCVCLSLFVLICVCVYSLAFVCTFSLLTGWPAAVLESLLTESVGSVGYFYPLACVCESRWRLCGLQQGHTVTSHAATLLSAACSVQTSRSECPFYKNTVSDDSKGLHWQSGRAHF